MPNLEDLFQGIVADKKSGNLGSALNRLNAFLTEEPYVAPAWNERGAILSELGHPFDAMMNYDKAIALAPKSAAYFNNRGVAYLNMQLFQKAISDFSDAVYFNPQMPEPMNSLAVIMRKNGDVTKAIEWYRKAIEVRPDYADAHLGLSFALLEDQQFEEGWNEFEWRWKTGQMPARGLPYPVWEGQEAARASDGLLIYAEQGFGDALQFMRYAAVVDELWGGQVYFEVKHPLTRITKTLKKDIYFSDFEVLTLGEKIPSNVTHCVALMSLPRYIKSIPLSCPYLTADEHLTSLWKARVKQLPPGFLVGICWAGMNRKHDPILDATDKARSMRLADFAPLAEIRGISWVSLQQGTPSSEVFKPPAGMTILDPAEDLHDFYDTAALISNLDLVITVDTAVAHLAGALGKPVWMLSRKDGCWRWFGDRSDSPYYPSLRQFRQKELGAWEPVVLAVKQELEKCIPCANQSLAA